jgi:hypothetical protein
LLVPHPPEVRMAGVGCSTTGGTIQISQRGDTEATQVLRPDSPLYNLKNPACGGHVTCAFSDTSPTTVVAITCTNDTADDANFIVTVGMSYSRKTNELVSSFSTTVPSRKSCFVFIVFQTVSTDDL